MKKVFLALFLAFVSVLPMVSSAELYQPEKISIGDATTYDGGSEVTLTFTPGMRPVGKLLDIEYGIAKTTKRDVLRFFTVVSTEAKDLKGIESLPSLPVTIPNVAAIDATSTYVVYVKYFEKNNPMAEAYFFTPEFKITESAAPFTNVKNINLLQAAGQRFALASGPSIYSPEYVKDFPNERLSTSTAVEVTFTSNQDVVLNPVITISKLRSDSFQQKFTLDPITVQKGETYAVLQLPTLEYQSGIYAGKLSFENENIKNIFDVQYIVSGDAVTVGQVKTVEKDGKTVFGYEIFGVPVDLIRTPDATVSNQKTYAVTTDFIDAKGKVIESLTQNVDFNQESFTTPIPQKKFFKTHIENIRIKVVSDTGKIAFEGSKNVAHVQRPEIELKNIYVYIIGIIALLLAILFIVKRRKAAIVTLILLSISGSALLFGNSLVFGQSGGTQPLTEEEVQANTAAQNLNVDMSSWRTYGTYLTGGIWPISHLTSSPGGQKNGSGDFEPEGKWNDRNTQMYTQGDIPSYTYQCGQPITVGFQFRVGACYNDITIVDGAVYFGSYDGRALQRWFHHPEGGNHDGLVAYIGYTQATLPAQIQNATLTSTTQQFLAWDDDDDGYQQRTGARWDYAIPLKNNCSLIPEKCACEGRTKVCRKSGLLYSSEPNSPSCQIQASCQVSVVSSSTPTVTFTQNTQNAVGTLSFTDLTTNQNDGGNTKTFDIIAGQTVIKKTRITDSFDNTSTTTICSALRPNENNVKSACVGRDMVFTNTQTNTETNRIAKDPACSLTASCSSRLSGDNVIFTNSVVNVIGSILYKDANTGTVLNNPITLPIAPGQTIVQRVLVTDRGDSATTTTNCTYTRPNQGAVCSCDSGNNYVCTYSDGRPSTTVANSPACTITTTTQCACSGRNYACRDSSGQLISMISNAAQCAFGASCQLTKSPDQDYVSVYNIVENALGTVTYKETANGSLLPNPYQKPVSPGQTVTAQTIVTDATDGSSVTTQCTWQEGVPTCSCSGTTQVCRNANGSIVSSVRNSPQCSTSRKCEGSTMVTRNAQGKIIAQQYNSSQCVSGPSTCSCSGRDYVCRNSSNVVTTTSPKDARCAFSASCSAQVVGGAVTFTQTLTNAIGNAVYTNAANGVPVNNPSSEPIGMNQTITRNTFILDTFDGATTTTQCSGKRTTDLPPTCACSGRDMVCRDAEGGLISSTKSSACEFKAQCTTASIDVANNTATFEITFTNRLGNVTYQDLANPSAPYSATVPLAAGGSIVRNIVVTDSADNSSSTPVCFATRAANKGGCEVGLGYVIRNSAGNIVSSNPSDSRCTISTNYQCACEGVNGTNRVCRDVTTNTVLSQAVADTLLVPPLVCPDNPSEDPEITSFKTIPGIVKKGEICNYVWSTKNLTQCALRINGVDVSLSSLGSTVGNLVTFSRPAGSDDTNQQAVLTCQRDGTPTVPTVTVAANAVCSIIPGVLQN